MVKYGVFYLFFQLLDDNLGMRSLKRISSVVSLVI